MRKADAKANKYSERLEEWPWAIGPLYEAPEGKLIEKHAEGHLSRALAIGRVTAFIGSGASAAYGRIGWLELIDAISDFYLAEYNHNREDLKTNLLATRIYELLKKHHRRGIDSKAVDQLARYQLAADLSREMAIVRKIDDFADRLAWMVRDARGHVRWLLEQLGTEPGRQMLNAMESEHVPSAWLPETSLRVNSIIETSVSSARLEHALRPDPADYTPSRLHRVVAALVMLPEQQRAEAVDALLSERRGSVADDARASRVSADRDPLKIVLTEFKINRFLTTNYDHEIEHLFREAGYKASASSGRTPTAAPSTPARAVWRDLIFTYETSGELGALVSRDRSAEAWVVHLHGRAERAGNSQQSSAIIATEDDYRARYERLDKSRSVIDDTIRLTFGSSPLLFLGIGFDEIDLLRPLRQFMSAPGRMGDRLAVALLPRHSDEPSSELRKIDLLQRFGVYTIHYGGEWLYRVHAISRALAAALDARRRKLADTDIRDAIGQLAHEMAEASATFDFRENVNEVDPDDHLTRDLRDLRHACEAAQLPRLDGEQLLAHSIRARGAVTSITTAALCRKLRDLQRVRDAWIGSWYTVPAPKQINRHPDRLPLRRHLPVLHLANDVAWPDSFYSGAASQTFKALMSALSKAPSLLRPMGKPDMIGTRAFLFVAPRGLGKGHFFSALASQSRIDDFCKLIGSGQEVPPAFVNLSFSIEVASVFDRLAEYLWNHALDHEVTDRERQEHAWRSLEKDRIQRLTLALKAWTLKKRPARAIVAFNNVNMLFDRQGRPKNRQLRELFNVLAPASLREGAPIDLVFVASGSAAPTLFREVRSRHDKDGSHVDLNQRPTLLEREDISARGQHGTRRMLEECGVSTQGDREDPNRFVHVLHYARASIVCTAFFPSVALLIAADSSRNDEGKLPPLPGHPVTQARSVRDLFEQEESIWILRNPKKAIPFLLLAAVRQPNGLAGLLSTPGGGIQEGALCADDEAFKEWLRRNQPSMDTSDRAIDVLDRAFRDIYHACGDSRFALTLLFSAMNEPLESPQAMEPDKRQAIGEKVLHFKTAVCSQANRIPPVRRTDFIIRNVLEDMRDRHEGRAALSDEARKALEQALGRPTPPPGLPMFDLQESILWHLSVASIPLEVEVLCGCPLVQSAAKGAFNELIPDNVDTDPAPIVTFAVRLLVSRCLVFRLEATPPSKTMKDGSPDYRYSVHRMVQRHFLRRTGAGFIEYPDIDEFSLTLYANQPNDTPYLTVEGHEQLRRTVSALSVHPEGVDAGKRDDEWPTDKDLQARRLRAAYSILRSIYSVSAVSHFDIKHRRLDLPARPAGTLMSPGFFEEHRRQILWLLHQARKFDGLTSRTGGPAPFYAEDVVWLYNEAGVLSLAEGHLPESQSLFESADKAAESIEPHELGPVRLLIRLNQAAAQIDRGRLQHADELLKHIVVQLKKEPEENDGVLLAIAEGYRAIVAHLKGYYEEAQELYKRVSLKLANARRSRAASLFARSHANLLLRNGDWVNSRERIQVALQLATDDSHEDMRHLALLTQARRSVAGLNDPSMKDGEGSRTIHANLNGIEQYARMMGMRKLACEVDEVRARLYLKNGDLQAAGTAAMNSLEIASLNELGIQKGAVLLLLADINLQRDHFSACRAYLEEAERVARETDYHIGTIDAQQIRDRLRAQDLTDAKV